MTDDPKLRHPQDALRISLEEDYEVRYWTEKWGIDRDTLEKAVKAVGHRSSAVAVYLGKPD